MYPRSYLTSGMAVRDPKMEMTVVDVDEPIKEEWPGLPSTSLETGLCGAEVDQKLQEFGRNEVIAIEIPEWKKLAKRYLALIPLIMMLAACLSIGVVTKCNREDKKVEGSCECKSSRDWASFVLLVFELNLIVIVDYLGERNSGNAIKELKRMAAPEANCKRNGKWGRIPVAELVPGDVVGLVIGAAVPADGYLVGDGEPLKLDVAALTGEPLPETKRPGDKALAGSMVLSGELDMVVCRTGSSSTMGQAMSLIAGVTDQGGNLKRLLANLARGIALGASFVCLILFFVRLIRDDRSFADSFKFAVVILVAVLPVALPVVVTTGLAVGALELSKHKAIVQRLSAIEELAGMDILCSDKTGTLTLGKMSVDEKSNYIFPAKRDNNFEKETVTTLVKSSVTTPRENYGQTDLKAAALLASRLENTDAIDTAINKWFSNDDAKAAALDKFTVERFIPFNPKDKMTKAYVFDKPTGKRFVVVKGAPPVINQLPGIGSEARKKATTVMDECAARGLKTLAIAASLDVENEMEWTMIGYLALLDPPRSDTEATITEAQNRGVEVKMISGDQRKIVIEVAKRLNMKTNIFGPEVFYSNNDAVNRAGGLGNLALAANGFAGVHPEHKYKVVEALQTCGHTVGMTGDGVNDAPALAIANVGIAVADATDAARGAADIVLTQEGLSTIVIAINKSRIIFRRLESYIIYRLASSCLILGFFTLTTIALNFEFPTWVLIVLSIINDFTVMATSKDNMRTSNTPLRWDVPKLSLIAATIGAIGIIQSFLLLYLLRREHSSILFWQRSSKLEECRVVAAIYLDLALTIQLNIFSARTKSFFFDVRDKEDAGAPLPSKILVAPVIGACIGSTFIAVYWPATLRLGSGAAMRGVGWSTALLVWIWVLLWFAVVEVAKVQMYNLNQRRGYQSLLYGSLFDEEVRPGLARSGSVVDDERSSQRNLMATHGLRAVASDDDESSTPALPELLPVSEDADIKQLVNLLGAMRHHILALETRVETMDGKQIHIKTD